MTPLVPHSRNRFQRGRGQFVLLLLAVLLGCGIGAVRAHAQWLNPPQALPQIGAPTISNFGSNQTNQAPDRPSANGATQNTNIPQAGATNRGEATTTKAEATTSAARAPSPSPSPATTSDNLALAQDLDLGFASTRAPLFDGDQPQREAAINLRLTRQLQTLNDELAKRDLIIRTLSEQIDRSEAIQRSLSGRLSAQEELIANLEVALGQAAQDFDATKLELQRASERVVTLSQRLEVSETSSGGIDEQLAQTQLELAQTQRALGQQASRTLVLEAELVASLDRLSDTQRALQLAKGSGVDAVEFILAEGVDDPLNGLGWSVRTVGQDGALGAVFMEGDKKSFDLPATPGTYRITGVLGTEQANWTISVTSHAIQRHRLSFQLARLNIAPPSALPHGAQLTLVRDGALTFAAAMPQAVQALYVQPGAYTATMLVGDKRFDKETEVSIGQISTIAWNIDSHQVTASFVTGHDSAALPRHNVWTLWSQNDQSQSQGFLAEGTGPLAQLNLVPGAYELQFGYDGFTDRFAFTLDPSAPPQVALTPTLTLGGLGFEFTNNQRKFPAGPTINWTVKNARGETFMSGSGPIGEHSLLPAGVYLIAANTAHASISRRVVVTPGQSTSLQPDFRLGLAQITLQDAAKAQVETPTTWVVSNIATGTLFNHSTDNGVFSQYLPAGTYNIIARHAQTSLSTSLVVLAGQISSDTLTLSATDALSD